MITDPEPLLSNLNKEDSRREDAPNLTEMLLPDQRVRVFVSSTIGELKPERDVARQVITDLISFLSSSKQGQGRIHLEMFTEATFVGRTSLSQFIGGLTVGSPRIWRSPVSRMSSTSPALCRICPAWCI